MIRCKVEDTVFVGIDVHRHSFSVTCIHNGRIGKRCSIPPETEVLIGVVRKTFPNVSQVESCYEAGFSGFWLHRELTRAGFVNKVVHPAAIPIQVSDKVKTDKRDSLKLAKLLAMGELRSINIPSPSQERARLLSRNREQLVRARRRIQSQVRMRLHQFGLLPKDFRGVVQLKHVEAFIEQINHAELVFNLKLSAEHWGVLQGQIRQMDRMILKTTQECALCKLYQSIPGIGALTAYVLATELGDMKQFANVKGLAAFVGLTPSEHSSGDKVWRGGITRQGNPRIRALLVQAAWIAVGKDPEMKKHFLQLSVRAGKKRAIVAVARKLIIRARALIRSNSAYKINFNQVV